MEALQRVNNLVADGLLDESATCELDQYNAEWPDNYTKGVIPFAERKYDC